MIQLTLFGDEIRRPEPETSIPDEGVLGRCNPGDIWQLGDHRLMCGDSTDLETVKRLMGGAKADLILTDPPYGTTRLYWDKAPDLNKMFEVFDSIREPNTAELIFGTQPFVTDLINARRKEFRYEIIWKKHSPTGFFNAKKRPMRIHENIVVFYAKQPSYNPIKSIKEDAIGIGRKRKNSNFMRTNGGHVGKVGKEKAESYYYEEDGTRYPCDIIECSNWNGALFGKRDNVVPHPTQKPIGLIALLIEYYSDRENIVFDAFGGSGTTLIAAEQLGRKCFMMELDPHYCDVILARWEKMTGKEATKLN